VNVAKRKKKQKNNNNNNKRKNRTKTTKKQNNPKTKSKNGKYAKKLTFGAQVGVEVRNFNLHMVRAREIPY
jgi:hypothetical protein